MADYKEDLTIYEEDLKGYVDTPKGVEYSTIHDIEKDSNWLLYTGITYIGSGLIGGTAGAGKQLVSQVLQKQKPNLGLVFLRAGQSARKTSNLCASTVFTFGLFKRIISVSCGIHEESIIASTVSGFAVGSLLKARHGYIKSTFGGILGAVVGGLSSLTSRSVVLK